jgi:hypothetical protein
LNGALYIKKLLYEAIIFGTMTEMEADDGAILAASKISIIKHCSRSFLKLSLLIISSSARYIFMFYRSPIASRVLAVSLTNVASLELVGFG